MQTFSITINAEQNANRVDKIFSEVFSEKITRSQLKNFGTFFRDEKELPPKTIGREGEIWRLEVTEPDTTFEPWDFPLKIIEESENWAAIDKPTGISVHPSATEKGSKTIVNALTHAWGKAFRDGFIKNKSEDRPGIIHRLDKETSGVLLVAKNLETLRDIQAKWDNTEKVYYAVVLGIPPKSGKISAGIARHKVNRTKMSVSNDQAAKEAVTFFERIYVSSDQKLSLLKIKIPTGRTHQIRVHLSSIGFAILGDDKYGKKKDKRMYLHAQSLTFDDPHTKKRKTIESEISEEFLVLFPHKKNL